jgi:hypothetical protein
MSDQQGMPFIHLLNIWKAYSPLKSRNEGCIINISRATTLPLPPFLFRIYSYMPLIRQTFNVVCHLFPSSFATPRGLGKAVARLFYHALVFTLTVQFILYNLSGITAHLASQAHTVARNTRSITSAVCALPVPFKGLICAGIDSNLPSPFGPSVDHSPAWHPFLVNEEVHGPAVDFAIHKAANATSAVLALVRASDLSQRHEISDKLKDFLQRAWACGLTSGAHLALVKTTVDE